MRIRITLGTLTRVMMGVFVVLLVAAVLQEAQAHKAPSGMPYDPTCCNENDCAVVQREKRSGDGVTYYTRLHREGVHFTFKEIQTMMRDGTAFRVKYSDDGFAHVCADQIGNIYRGDDGEFYDLESGEAKIDGEVKYYVYCLYLPAGVQ